MITNASLWGALKDQVNNDVFHIVGDGAPTSGTSGSGVLFAGPGSTYTDYTNSILYINTNTKASPTWTVIGTSTSATLTNPTINAGSGVIVLPNGTTPAQTAEGSIFWDSDDDLLTVGDGASRKTMVSTAATQTLTNKTLTSPTMTAPVLGVATGTSLAVTGLLKTSSPSAGFGFATGAGGTATQITSKATTTAAVPDPSSCGSITTHNATLNAATIVSFTFTNSAIAATDVLVLNHLSGGTIGSYTLNAQCGAGSATINIRNNTAGNLGEALVIQYVLIKGVNA